MEFQIPSTIIHKVSDEVSVEYTVGQFLGKGGFARCHAGINMNTNKPVAIKVVHKGGLKKSRAKQKLLLEIKIHRNLNHLNIVKFETAFEDKTNVYIILELCTCRTLNQMAKKRKFLTPPEVRFYMKQLLSALEYLHSQKIIHRDLKMGNIFLSGKMDLKLGDFGLSAKLEFNEERKRTMAGTPNYIAPEIIDGSGGHSYEVDIWSTGVICFALLFGRPPFESSDLKMTYSRIKNCEYNFPIVPQVPSTGKEFIRKILILDPKKRMSIKQMLSHPFMNENMPIKIPDKALKQVPQLQFFDQKQICTDQRKQQNNGKQISTMTSQKQQKSLKQQLKQGQKQQKLKNQKIEEIKKNSEQQQNLKASSVLQQKNKNIQKISSEISQKVNQQYFSIVVSAHVDYSVKYGLGYQLSTGSRGVYFNDSTLLSFDPLLNKFFYLKDPSHSRDYSSYQLSQLPTDKNLKKKKLLLDKIQGYMNNVPANEGKQTERQNRNSCSSENHFYLKQWLKTKHAIMFRLSNNIFQVNFFDNSQILLETEHKIIKFTSKKGLIKCATLNSAMNDSQSELGRRIKYTREILNSLKKGQKGSE